MVVQEIVNTEHNFVEDLRLALAVPSAVPLDGSLERSVDVIILGCFFLYCLDLPLFRVFCCSVSVSTSTPFFDTLRPFLSIPGTRH